MLDMDDPVQICSKYDGRVSTDNPLAKMSFQLLLKYLVALLDSKPPARMTAANAPREVRDKWTQSRASAV
jgi:hypothetical protein